MATPVAKTAITRQPAMRLEGMEFLQKQLKRAPEVVRKYASEAVGISSLRMTARARELVRVDTGLLKLQIVADLPPAGKLTGGVGIASTDVFYWYFVELGTVKMKARPFIRPAVEEGQSAFIADVRDAGPSIEHDMAEGRLF